MSKWLKLSAAAGVICCLLGIGVITLGAVKGGGRQIMRALDRVDGWDGHVEHDISDHFNHSSALLPDLPGDPGLPLVSEDRYDNIRSIELEVMENRVELRESAELEAGSVVIAHGGDSVRYQILPSGNTLKLKDSRRTRYENALENIILYVPEGFQFAEIEIENRGGSFEAEKIFAKELSLEVFGGDITIQGGSVRRLDVECNAGDITCRAAAGDEASAECKAGDLYLMMAGAREDYDYKLECPAGSIVLEGDPPMEFGALSDGHKIDHSTGHEVKLECSAGAITVGYQEPVL